MGNPPPLSDTQLDDVQGDIWSKGFPKNYETYYFFSIKGPEKSSFPACLKNLVEQKLISTLRAVSQDRDEIMSKKREAEAAREAGDSEASAVEPISNALIAFTSKGLKEIQKLIPRTKLELDKLEYTDPSFEAGMASEDVRKRLSDPEIDKWDELFRSSDIHGLLKVAGGTKEDVEARLKRMQEVLKRGEVIVDVPGKSAPTATESRVDGWTRPDRGKEHFGFRDGISQPLMGGVDRLEPKPDGKNDWIVNMNTDPKLLIVTQETHRESDGEQRPGWMFNGSFLVFRKLEQDVGRFRVLTNRFGEFNCLSQGHMGAKLMGRWPSGAPIALPQFHHKDSENEKELINNFGYGKEEACPVSAHIRKTNLRTHLDHQNKDPRAFRSRIIRSGIAYGSEYERHEEDRSRGLLFVCYQGLIEDGFQHMQEHWCNSRTFLHDGTGHDPIVAQAADGNLTTTFTDQSNNKEDKKTVTFQSLVTLKGGDYFFAPSISALRGKLAGN